MVDSVSLATAFIFGGLSFFSPCVLPLVPAYLSYLAGDSALLRSAAWRGGDNADGAANTASVGADMRGSRGAASQASGAHARPTRAMLKRRLMVSSLSFVLGFSLVFVALGATASALGSLLLSNIDWLGQVAGGIIVVLGLHYLGLFRITFLLRDIRFAGPSRASGVLGGFVLGTAFGFAWTPCIGPILGAILAVAAQSSTITQGVVLLSVYALGLAIPFLLCAWFVEQAAARLRSMGGRLRTLEMFTGGLLVLTGLLMISGDFGVIGNWLLDHFPALQRLG